MIQILITSYNRPDALRQLLWDFDQQATDKPFAVHVHHDSRNRSTFKPSKYKLSQSTQTHEGKQGFWQTITNAWRRIKAKATTVIQLPDDIRVDPEFISNAVRQWQAIENDKKICLNLRMDKARVGKPCWTKRVPTIEGNAFRVGWVDGCFISGIKFFDALEWKINPIDSARWVRQIALSSGVGMQISVRLDNAGYAMYQVRNTILKEAHLPSQMNQEANQGVKKQEYNLPPLIAGMATMPGREKQVVKAIESILPQVDELHVFCNYELRPSSPVYSFYPKIMIYDSGTTGPSDRGDSGKFFGHFMMREKPHYYFSFDDDIIYPPGYVWKMWQYMDKWDNRPAVGIHAQHMKPSPIRHYYHNARIKQYHCRYALDKPRKAHILGTGTLGFYSETISLKPEDFPLDYMNMADIHFGIVGQRLNVPFVALPRPDGYIQVQDLPKGTTIYERHHKRDRKQTRRFNSIEWKLNEL